MKLEGNILSLTGSCPDVSFFIQGTRIVADRSTEYKKGKCGDLRAGRSAKVTGLKSNGFVQATKIELD